MSDTEKIEVYSDEGSFAEEDWNELEQNEVTKSVEPDKPIITKTRRGGRKKTSMTYNRSGDDFLIDKIKSGEIGAELVGVGEFVPDQDWQITKDDESF